ncbi:MAG: hypothetical protein R2911_03540 [Caldilineaceae bacterium]
MTPFVEEPTVPDPNVYAQDALYPPQPAAIAELGFMRSQRLAFLLSIRSRSTTPPASLFITASCAVAIRFSESSHANVGRIGGGG